MSHRMLGIVAVVTSLTLGALAPACSSSGTGGSTTTTTSSTGGTGGTTTSSTSTSTTSSVDGGDGGEAGPPANDTCATAEVHSLTVGGSPLTVTGTTTGSVTTFTGSCGASTPGVVYKVTTTAEGTLTLAVTAANGSKLVPIIYQQTTCGTSDQCFILAGAQTSIVENLSAGTYYFIVAGGQGTSGDFTLTASLATPTCGDGAVNTGETCDLGSVASSSWQSDGCYPPGNAMQCQTVPGGTAEATCPGKQILVPAGTSNQNLDPNGTTIGFPKTYSGSCNQMGTCPMCPGPSRVYNLVPQASGTLTVSIGYETDGVTTSCNADMNAAACWDMTLFARTTCADSATEITGTDGGTTVGCADPAFPDAAIVSFPVVAGMSYYVFVVGYDDGTYGAGPYNLFVTLN
jgi:hypothetical protein